MSLLSIKKNGCELTIFVEDGKVFPKAFGKVPDKLNKGIKELTGVSMKPEMALTLLKNNF